MNIELGKPVIFTLQSGAEKTVIVYGQLGDGQWDIEVNGTRTIYTDLQSAIGEPYVNYRYA